MQKLTLNNGVQMPLLGFGTWELRGAACETAVAQAIEAGYRMIDTAQMYDNEQAVGKGIRSSGIPREEMFITTKLYRPSASYPKAKSSVEKSLHALGVDTIDLMLIHEPYLQAVEMYRALEEDLKAGKIRAIGISNFNASRFDWLLSHCSVTPAVNQVESHVYFPQLDLQRHIAAHGTVMEAWGPFTEGRKRIFSEPILRDIGAAHGKTAAQVALRYLVQHGIVVIPKSAKKSRIQENAAIFDFVLTEEELRQIAGLNGGRTLFGWYD